MQQHSPSCPLSLTQDTAGPETIQDLGHPHPIGYLGERKLYCILCNTSTFQHRSIGQLSPKLTVPGVQQKPAAIYLTPPPPTEGGHETSPYSIPRIEIHPDLEKADTYPALIKPVSLVTRLWVWELVSCLIGASCMGAMAVVFMCYNNRKLPDWPLQVTLNACISILSGIIKCSFLVPTAAALGQLKWNWFRNGSKKMVDFELFDDASRGAWGSFWFLLQMRGKCLASLGAAIMLLSIGLDPVFQQVVTYPQRWTLQSSHGSLNRTILYDPPPAFIHQDGATKLLSDQEMRAVVTPFLFGNGTTRDPPSSCPTSNCTWPPYETLGVCSSCEDISKLLTFSCLETNLRWLGRENKKAVACGWYLNATGPSPVLMSGYALHPVTSKPKEGLSMRMFSLFNYLTGQTYWDGSVRFKEIQNPIVDFLIVSSQNGTTGLYSNSTPVAHECVLHWCTKTLASSYYLGRYSEEVIATYHNRTPTPFPWDFNSPGDNGVYTQDIWIKPPRQNFTFGLSNNTAMSVNANLQDILPSWLTVDSPSDGIPTLSYKINSDAPISRTLDYDPWIPPSNLTQHMDRLATAMTNVMRSMSNTSEEVLGSVWDTATYVNIRWEWLTLPFGLLLFSLSFLIATVVKCHKERHQVGIWKASALAMLVNGLREDVHTKLGAPEGISEARDRAKELNVKLLPDRIGWRLSTSVRPTGGPGPGRIGVQ